MSGLEAHQAMIELLDMNVFTQKGYSLISDDDVLRDNVDQPFLAHTLEILANVSAPALFRPTKP